MYDFNGGYRTRVALEILLAVICSFDVVYSHTTCIGMPDTLCTFLRCVRSARGRAARGQSAGAGGIARLIGYNMQNEARNGLDAEVNPVLKCASRGEREERAAEGLLSLSARRRLHCRYALS